MTLCISPYPQNITAQIMNLKVYTFKTTQLGGGSEKYQDEIQAAMKEPNSTKNVR